MNHHKNENILNEKYMKVTLKSEMYSYVLNYLIFSLKNGKKTKLMQ